MRTTSHIIDTRTIKKVFKEMPDHWVVRDLSERDYGIDLDIEIFAQSGLDDAQKPAFHSTGATCHIQLKGTDSPPKILKRSKTVPFSLGKDALLYAERFSTPFFLFHVDVTTPLSPIYFVWVQRYIKDVLDIKKPSWRASAQKSYTINIPTHNDILGADRESCLNKIWRIALRPKYIEELVEYHATFVLFDWQMEAADADVLHLPMKVILQEAIESLTRLKQLRVLLTQNNSCVDASTIDDVIAYLQSIANAGGAPTPPLAAYPWRDNLKMLSESIPGLFFVEDAEAENNRTTVY